MPEEFGLDSAALASGIQSLGRPASEGPLMIVANGRVVYTVGDTTARQSTFSCSKLVTGMLAAKALQDRLIQSLDSRIPNQPPGAMGSTYPGDATLRHFLTMTSDYGLPLPNPGTRYAYNNNALDFLGEHLSQAVFGGYAPGQMHLLVRDELFATLGRQDGESFVGQWGGWFGGIQLSVRDLGRIGLLLLRNGAWNGQRMLTTDFVDGLFESQIGPSVQRYQSSIPNEDSQWNQQAVTDQLGGNWSFGLWRVDAAASDGRWVCAAAEGFRGKRIILMPRGTLADPHLEVMMVCLPSLNDEGPLSSQYRQLVQNAVLPPPIHPEDDLACVAATFDDGTLFPFRSRLGAPFVRDGGVVLEGEQRLVLADATTADTHVLWRLVGGLPIGAWSGVVMRAATPASDHDTPGGSQVLVRVARTALGSIVAEVLSPALGSPIVSQPVRGVNAAQPMVISVRLVDSVAHVSINEIPAFPGTGATGVPGATVSGYTSLRHGGPFDGSQSVDYLLARPANGPSAYVESDTEGVQTLVVFEPNLFSTLDPNSWFTEFTFPGWPPLPFPMTFFGALLPAVWPNFIGFDQEHLVFSSRNAPLQLPSGTSKVFEYRGLREGDLIR